MLKLNIQFFAHKKGVGSTRNGRDSESKRLGVKLSLIHISCYLFTATQNVAQSVDILLGQIGAPYLTDENVEKEKGIIAQEIKMYDDDPDWRSTFDLLGCLYHNDPVKRCV